MIHAQVIHAPRYHAVHPLFPAAFTWLAGPGAAAADGKHVLDDERMFAIVQSGMTEPAADRRFESHRRYLDIQVSLPTDAGEGEIMEWAPVDELLLDQDFTEGGDIRFHRDPVRVPTRAWIRPGEFAVFFPEDAHRPCCAISLPAAYRKVVFKLQVRL